MKRDQRREFFYNKTLKVEVHKYSYIDILLWRISWCMQSISSHYEMDNSHSERVLIELSIQACKRAQSALCETCTRI